MARNSEIFAQLDPAVVKKLEEKQIRYTRYLIDERHKPYASWQQSFMTDDRKVRLELYSHCTGKLLRRRENHTLSDFCSHIRTMISGRFLRRSDLDSGVLHFGVG